MRRTVIGNLNLEGDDVAFEWGGIATGQRLDCDKIRQVGAPNRFRKVIAICRWVRLVAHRRGRCVDDGVSTLASIQGAFQRQRHHVTIVQSADGPYTAGGVVTSSSRRSVVDRRGQFRRKQVGQRDIRCLGCTIVRDLDLEGNYIAFGWCVIQAG